MTVLVMLFAIIAITDMLLSNFVDTGKTGWTLAAVLAFGFALDALYGLMAPDRQFRRNRKLRQIDAAEARMTAPFPTRKQEEWRYADLDALKPVWEQLGDAATLIVAPGESLEEVWLPTADDVQVQARAAVARRRREGAHFRAQHCAGLRPHRA